MYKDFANFIRTNKADLLNDWMNEMEKQSDQLINDIAKEAMYEETSKEFVDLIVSNVTENGSKFNEKLDDFAEKVVHLGWPIHFVTTGLRVFGLLVYTAMRDEDLFLKEKKNLKMMPIIALKHGFRPCTTKWSLPTRIRGKRQFLSKKVLYRNYLHHFYQYLKKFL